MFFNIIILTYNSSKYLRKCLNSVATQNFSEYEILIIDKFSSDNTHEIIDNYIKNFSNLKVYKKNLGLYESLNFAYKKLNSKYSMILHSDDYFERDDCLEKIADFINENKNPDIIYSNLKIIKNKKLSRNWESGVLNFKNIKRGWMPPHPTMIIKSSIIKENNLEYDCTLKISADYDFFLNLFLNYKIKFLYFNYYYYVMRSGGLSSKNLLSQLIKLKEDNKIIRKYNLPFYTFLMKRLIKLKQFL